MDAPGQGVVFGQPAPPFAAAPSQHEGVIPPAPFPTKGLPEVQTEGVHCAFGVPVMAGVDVVLPLQLVAVTVKL